MDHVLTADHPGCIDCRMALDGRCDVSNAVSLYPWKILKPVKVAIKWHVLTVSTRLTVEIVMINAAVNALMDTIALIATKIFAMTVARPFAVVPFSVVKNEACGKSGCTDRMRFDVTICHDCKHVYCQECRDSSWCRVCHNRYCLDCRKSFYCEDCDNAYCVDCKEHYICQVCKVDTCADCADCCKGCNTLLCPRYGHEALRCDMCNDIYCGACRKTFFVQIVTGHTV